RHDVAQVWIELAHRVVTVAVERGHVLLRARLRGDRPIERAERRLDRLPDRVVQTQVRCARQLMVREIDDGLIASTVTDARICDFTLRDASVERSCCYLRAEAFGQTPTELGLE